MRRASNRARAWGLLLVTPGVLGAAAGAAQAHPSHEERAERARLQTLCSRAANPAKPFDPVHLGNEQAELRAAWGDALRARVIERPDPGFGRLARPRVSEAPGPSEPLEPPEPAGDADPYAGQLRLWREGPTGDVLGVEYELFGERVYRIRWELGERFHAPIMDALVRQASHCYGPPEYDQTIEAALASGEVTRRRAGWRREGRLLEIRQLNPLLGGPVFVTVTDVEASRAIIAARGSLAPEPERRSAPWWKRSARRPHLPSEEERSELVRAFAAILSQTDF